MFWVIEWDHSGQAGGQQCPLAALSAFQLPRRALRIHLARLLAADPYRLLLDQPRFS